MINVRGHENEPSSPNVECQLQNSALFSLVDFFVVRVRPAHDGKAREHGVAVFAALKIVVVAEDARHAGEFRQFGRQIAPRGALDAFVHFLQRHDVRARAFDQLGDAQQVNFAIQSLGVMDVVSHHPERMALALFRSRLASGPQGCGTEKHRQAWERGAKCCS
jgi:hypothetical protein